MTNAGLLDERELTDIPPIDKYGRPTTYLAFRILRLMFSQPRRFLAPEELAKLLAAKRRDTILICHQLKLLDLLSQDPSQPDKYKYNLSSTNTETQAAFESFLVEVELEALPVHIMFDYSPSYRSPGALPVGHF